MTESSSSSTKCGIRFIGNSGLKVSNLCLGAMTFGSTDDALFKMPGQRDEAASHEILDKFVEMGGNFIDTANVYSAGRSESIVGSWLKKQDREQIIIATKVRFPTGSGPNDVGLSRKHILHSVEESLKRLQTSYIDLYQTHGWDEGTPIEETLRTLTDLVRQGKVRYLGLSNVTGWQLQKIIDLTKYKNYEPFVSLQVQYNLMCRETEWELQEVCKREGLGILPWSPLKTGWLTGKVTRSGAPTGSRVEFQTKDTEKLPFFRDYANEEQTWQIIDALKAISAETGKSVPQVALKWLLHQETVSSVIIGAKKMEQLVDNMGAGDDSWKLTADQLKRLGDVSDITPMYPYSMLKVAQMGRGRNGVLVL